MKRSLMNNIFNGVFYNLDASSKNIHPKSIRVGKVCRLAAGKCQPYNGTGQVKEN
jgi:hypothetical protein